MNIGFIVCGGACLLFLLLTLIFTIFKEKSVMLISGFNTMPKEKRELYDSRSKLFQRSEISDQRKKEDYPSDLAIWKRTGCGFLFSLYLQC